MPRPEPNTPVTILGAGIVGICTALSLLERGVPVTLIDKGAPGQQTSMGNAGVVSPWSVIPQATPGIWKSIPGLMFGYGRPLSIHWAALGQMIPWGLRFLRSGKETQMRKSALAMSHLCGPSIELFQKHLQGTGHDNLLVDSFYVHAFRRVNQPTLKDLGYQIRREMGADLELVGKDRLAQIEPALSPEFHGAIVIKGQARVRSPGRLAQVLAEKAQRLGATFIRSEIRSIRQTENGWQITCDGSPQQAQRIVICLGAWSKGLLQGLGLDVPLMAERGYHVEFPQPGIELNNSVMDMDAKVVASSMEGGVRVAGQAEFAPVDAPPTRRREKQIVQIAKAALPQLNAADNRFWMGRRPSFPDSLPMIDHVAGKPGLYLNFGHSHYGLMMSPASGELVTKLICGDTPNTDLAPYAATRF